MDELFSKVQEVDTARSEEDRLDGAIFEFLFLKRDPLIADQIFPSLKNWLNHPSSQEVFLKEYRRTLENEREHLASEIKKCEAAGRDVRFYTRQLAPVERQLAIDSLDGYLAYLEDAAEGHLGIVDLLIDCYKRRHGEDDAGYVKECYPLYRIGSLLYGAYLAKFSVFERFERPYAAKLKEFYQDRLGVDLMTVDPQFAKYGLLSVGSTLSIVNAKEMRTLVDSRVGLHFGINIPMELLAAIEKAIANCWVTDIAFDVGAIIEAPPAFEAVERGSIFSFPAMRLPSVSKLYDEETYDDALWIKVETSPRSMTFEELCAGYPALGGHVVTQVVHLEFFEEQGRDFISHLDHEYILYTDDAYDLRRYDASIKGHKKQKTFKIDKARIPFDFTLDDRYFLFLVLDAYFKNKNLIREYFSRIQ